MKAAALLLLLGGCGSPENGKGNEAAAAETPAPAATANGAGEAPAPRETVLKSETVEAVFTGWEVGDYVWANLKIRGRAESGAFVGPTPLEHFLEAHKGKPITVRIDTVRLDIPEAGGEQDVPKIAAASAGGTSAEAWWQGLTAEQKQAAERQMEEVLGGGV